MKILLRKLTETEHQVRVIRADGSEDCRTLNTRSFLRHDFAHFAVESEVPFGRGYWGSVAGGSSLAADMPGDELMQAERLSGPVQTLMRTGAPAERYLEVLEQRVPALASPDLAWRIRESARQLEGHWRGTAYGEDMIIEWIERPACSSHS